MKRSTKRNVANNEGNHKITEYFSVRRSNRKTSTQLYKEKSDATIQAVISGSNEQNDCLRIVETIDQKGRGVIAARIFEKDDFVVEYRGDLIDANMAKHRERIYADDSTIGCYMYYFKHANRQYWYRNRENVP
jgi:histone-lysine N-methyltransferase SETD8